MVDAQTLGESFMPDEIRVFSVHGRRGPTGRHHLSIVFRADRGNNENDGIKQICGYDASVADMPSADALPAGRHRRLYPTDGRRDH